LQKDFSKPTEAIDWTVDPTLRSLPQRIDLFLKDKMITRSRTQIQSLFKKKRILVNSKPIAASYKLRGGEVVRILLDPDREVVKSGDIELDILFEDKDLIAVNKPAGLIMHPAGSITSGTLLNAVHYYFEKQGSAIRPGLFQRLDKNTSGIVLMPKNNNAHIKVQDQIISHSLDKIYLAICEGVLEEDELFVEAPITQVSHPFVKKMGVCPEGEGKSSKTLVKKLFCNGQYTLVGVKLYTGRQHQIRVHLSHINHPIVGDTLYGGSEQLSRQALHSYFLRFIHPSADTQCEILAPLPSDMQYFLSGNIEKWEQYEEEINTVDLSNPWNPKHWLDSNEH
jgi:23S rRNA pseudouridine1911/1915/1917 synthase